MIQKEFNLPEALAIQKGEKFGRIVTRDGKPARIVTTDAKGYRPVVALIDNGTSEKPCLFTVYGRNDIRENVTTSNDLVLEMEGGEE